MLDAATFFDLFKLIAIGASPDIPANLWPLTACLFGVLVLTAVIDALSATVPDVFIFFALLIGTGLLGFFASWEESGTQLRWAVAAGLFLWSVNKAWQMKFNQDCLGMGDAKWTVLAVFAFGLLPVAIAWGAGACMAVSWISAARLLRRRVVYVHFVPFLLIGLIGGIYWLRFY